MLPKYQSKEGKDERSYWKCTLNVSIATKHVYSTRSNITVLNAFPNINRMKEFQDERSHQNYTLNVSTAAKHDYMWQSRVEIEQRLCILIALPCSKCRDTVLLLWVGLIHAM